MFLVIAVLATVNIFFDEKPIDNKIIKGTISANEIANMFPACDIGDTVKVCLKSLYWRNGEGVKYSWVTPQPPNTAYGTPMEFNFFDNCNSPCGIGGAGTQHVFFINLFEGETEQIEIVIGWGIDYGMVWQAPSIVCGQPAPLGSAALFAIFDQDCTTMFWPSNNQPVGVCPVTQFDCTCPSCPSTPPPDTSNYYYTPGFNQSCKIVYCPI